MLAAAHPATTVRVFPSCFTSRLTPAHPIRSRHTMRKSTHSPVYAFIFDVSDFCQRLHVPRPSMSPLPCRCRTRPFLTHAENAPSLTPRCSPFSRTARASTGYSSCSSWLLLTSPTADRPRPARPTPRPRAPRCPRSSTERATTIEKARTYGELTKCANIIMSLGSDCSDAHFNSDIYQQSYGQYPMRANIFSYHLYTCL